MLLGTCGTVSNTVDDMEEALDGVPLGEISTAMNDPSPFTLLAFTLGVAKRRGVAWERISGTSNQSDYLSHFIANHMFYRLSLPGSRRVLTDHVDFCLERLPNWNPVSVVGQHMQQAGATPAETVGFTFSTALQYAEDCVARGMDIDVAAAPLHVLLRHLDQLLRGDRQVSRGAARSGRGWRASGSARRTRLPGASSSTARPPASISRASSRSTTSRASPMQAMAGILSGLQSMHTDAYDEAVATPTEETARIAVATQNILREEAHLCDVIDPLAGSYYVETLTDQMEAEILAVIASDRRRGRHVQGGRKRPRANHDRRFRAALSGEDRARRGEDRRRQLLSDRPDEEGWASRPSGRTSRACRRMSRASRRSRTAAAATPFDGALAALGPRRGQTRTKMCSRASSKRRRAASPMAKSSAACGKSWDLDVRSSSPEVPPALAALVDRLRRGEAAALSRCLSLVEQGGALADSICRLANPASGRCRRRRLQRSARRRQVDADRRVHRRVLRALGRTVAVAAVDPSSPISGGSVLGDRVRMHRHTEDPGVFIRSIASRGHLGGLSENIHRVVDLMDASGRDVIVIETVGAGQSEVEIVEIADVCVVVNAPNLGDEVQAIKAGILEIADILVVNKADLPMARRTTEQLRAMLSLRADLRDVPVIETVATSGAGIEALAAAIDARANGTATQKRANRLRRIRRLIAQSAGRRIRDRHSDARRPSERCADD